MLGMPGSIERMLGLLVMLRHLGMIGLLGMQYLFGMLGLMEC